MSITVHTSTGGIASTNAILVVDNESRTAVLFDAPDHTIEPLIKIAQAGKIDIIGLWLTHGHFDHIADHQVLTRHFPDAKVLIHPLDESKLLNAHCKMFPLPFDIPSRKADGYVNDGDELTLGAARVQVIYTPGHCVGHVSYYFPDEARLIGGDLIIGGSIGRTDLPDSDHSLLVASVRKIMKLPGNTTLYPGHGRINTLDQERQTNAYVQEMIR